MVSTGVVLKDGVEIAKGLVHGGTGIMTEDDHFVVEAISHLLFTKRNGAWE